MNKYPIPSRTSKNSKDLYSFLQAENERLHLEVLSLREIAAPGIAQPNPGEDMAELRRQLDLEKQEHERIKVIIERGKREWEATFDAVSEMILLTDVDHRIMRCNKSVVRTFSCTYNDLLGHQIEEVFLGKTRKANNVFLSISREVQFPVINGWFDVANYPLIVSGEAAGNVHVIKDITAAKIAQELLHKANDELEERVKERTNALSSTNEELKREVFERKKIQDLLEKEKELLAITLLSIRDGVISTDNNGHIMLFNRAAEIITGWSQNEVMDKPINKVLHLLEGKTNQRIKNVMDDLVINKIPGNRVQYLTLVTKDNQKALLNLSSTPMEDQDGNLLGYVLVFDNITEQKQLEAQLALSQKMEAIGQLAAGIAHEINTPMQFIGDNTHFLQEAFTALVEQTQVYDSIASETVVSNDLSSLAVKFAQAREKADLDYYSNEVPLAIKQSLQGVERVRKIVLAMKSFSHPGYEVKQMANLNQGIEDTVTITHNEWKYVAELEMILDPDLPMVFCKIGEINQVILNLIVNAAHAIQEALQSNPGTMGRIELRTSQKGEFVSISISDTGVGIPAANIDLIFNPFFTTKEVGRGTGQGLAIAHNIIVNKHQGTIQVESEVGKGTKFTILLPIGSEEVSEGEKE